MPRDASPWTTRGGRWSSRLVATAAANRLNIRRNLHVLAWADWFIKADKPEAVTLEADDLAGKFDRSMVAHRHTISTNQLEK
jgi:hypothetical protein